MLYFISFCKESEIFYKIYVLKNFYIPIICICIYTYTYKYIYKDAFFLKYYDIYQIYISENKSKTLPPSIWCISKLSMTTKNSKTQLRHKIGFKSGINK